MYTGAFIDAARAERVGLVSRVAPDDAIEHAAQEFIDAMLRTAPLGLRITKETLNTVLKINDLHAVIELEAHAQSICGRGPDFEEAMRAFLEKRPPDYAKSA
jgi:enoyl-CoA hydratase